jgi:hypothetical protein
MILSHYLYSIVTGVLGFFGCWKIPLGIREEDCKKDSMSWLCIVGLARTYRTEHIRIYGCAYFTSNYMDLSPNTASESIADA